MAQDITVSKDEFDKLAQAIYIRKAAARQGQPADQVLIEDATAAVRAAHVYFSMLDELIIEERKGGMK